jgi:hypothetical protein
MSDHPWAWSDIISDQAKNNNTLLREGEGREEEKERERMKTEHE